MHDPDDRRRHRLAAPILAVLLACCLGLAACGGSSGSTGSTAAIPTTGAKNREAKLEGRLASLRACLRRNGINLTTGAGVFPAVGAPLPNGVTRAQYLAVLRRCASAQATPQLSHGVIAAVEQFIACMRTHGVNLPPANTSGNGPLINAGGVNIHGAGYRAALHSCGPLLQAAIQSGSGPGTAPTP